MVNDVIGVKYNGSSMVNRKSMILEIGKTRFSSEILEF